MSRRVFVQIDEELERVLKDLKGEAARKAQRAFGFPVNVYGNVASKLAAKKLKGQRCRINFKVKKTALNRGYLDIL